MRFGLPGLGMKDTKMGKPKYHYKDSCSWTFQSLNNFKNSYRAIYDKIPVVPVSYREKIRVGRSEIFLNIFFMVCHGGFLLGDLQ
jgi:hypothetical protein